MILIVTLLFSCKDNSKVRIWVTWPGGQGLPHYNWKKGDDKPTGIEPAFIERILKLAELDYTYVSDFEFSGVGDPRIEVLEKNKADICIRAFSINEERKKHVLFTNPYYIDGITALVRKNDSIKTLSDLNGKRIYTLEFTSSNTWAKENLNNSTLLTYKKFDTAFVKPEGLLLNNEIDAYLLDKSFLMDLAKENNELEVLSSKFTEEIIGIAVNKNKPELVYKINKAMEEMKQNGDFDKLLKGLN